MIEVYDHRGAADTDFRFHGGRLGLDLCATLAARYREPVERLAGPADLARWIKQAMALDGDVPVTDRGVQQARQLREATRRLVHPGSRERPYPTDVELLNGWAGKRNFAPRLDPDARSVSLLSDRTVSAALATVARDTVDLLSGPWLERVRECARPDCSLLFVDLSRPGRRRWCDMARCGNVVKAERFRGKARAVAPGGLTVWRG